MSKQRSTEHGKKPAPPKRTVGAFVSPEKKGQTKQVYGPFNATEVNELQNTVMGGKFVVHDTRLRREIADMYGRPSSHFEKNVVIIADNAFKCVIPLHGVLPETAVSLSSGSNSRKRAAVTVHTGKSAKPGAKAPRRDFGDVLELDQDKVQSLNADALDGYGAHRAAFYIKKFATD